VMEGKARHRPRTRESTASQSARPEPLRAWSWSWPAMAELAARDSRAPNGRTPTCTPSSQGDASANGSAQNGEAASSRFIELTRGGLLMEGPAASIALARSPLTQPPHAAKPAHVGARVPALHFMR